MVKIYLIVQRKEVSMLVDAMEDMSILEFKNKIENVFKVPPSHQKLIYNDLVLNDMNTFKFYDITSITAKAHEPVNIGLAIKMENGDFEELDISPYTKPAEHSLLSENLETEDQE